VGIRDEIVRTALTSGFRCVHDKRRPPEELVFLANESGPDADRHLRSSPRLLCSTLVRWRPTAGRAWQVGLTHNLSLRGLYVRTIDPPAMGVPVEVMLRLPGAAEAAEVRGRVAWRKDFSARAVRSYPTGMGLALDEMSEANQRLFAQATELL